MAYCVDHRLIQAQLLAIGGDLLVARVRPQRRGHRIRRHHLRQKKVKQRDAEMTKTSPPRRRMMKVRHRSIERLSIVD
jgi:hypothetical protein